MCSSTFGVVLDAIGQIGAIFVVSSIALSSRSLVGSVVLLEKQSTTEAGETSLRSPLLSPGRGLSGWIPFLLRKNNQQLMEFGRFASTIVSGSA